MKAIIVLIILAGLGYGGYMLWTGQIGGIGGMGDASSNVEISGNTVNLVAGEISASFSTSGDLSGDFMLFGGTAIDHKNAISPVLLAGLNMYDAKKIYIDYPDFHKCSSPGASLAKPLVQDINAVPINSNVTAKLKKSLVEFNRNINMKDGGQRVCIQLTGKYMDMQNARIIKANMDVTSKFGMKDYHLITSAEIVDCQEILARE